MSSNNGSSFESIVEGSVMEAITKILGNEVWKAISFYFDPKSLSKEPDALLGTLEKLFGRNAIVLEKVIAETVLVRVQVPEERRRGSDFRNLIRIAKAKFISSTPVEAKPSF
jgi:hypothetical protein